jgi:hypothetical protein
VPKIGRSSRRPGLNLGLKKPVRRATPEEVHNQVFHGSAPALEGMDKYLHLVRAIDDPDRAPRPKGGYADRSPHHTLAKTDLNDWRLLIPELMDDGVPRTFNRMSLELIGLTADITHSSPIETALWELVAEGCLMSSSRVPMYFLDPLEQLVAGCLHCMYSLRRLEYAIFDLEGQSIFADVFGCENPECVSHEECGGVFHFFRTGEVVDLEEGQPNIESAQEIRTAAPGSSYTQQG